MTKHHYVYGSGMVGCLYDNGPHCAPTLRDAIEGALFPFDDGEMPAAELKRARRNLRVDGIHYFDSTRRYKCGMLGETMTARAIAGVDYVEVSKHAGQCPDIGEG